MCGKLIVESMLISLGKSSFPLTHRTQMNQHSTPLSALWQPGVCFPRSISARGACRRIRLDIMDWRAIFIRILLVLLGGMLVSCYFLILFFLRFSTMPLFVAQSLIHILFRCSSPSSISSSDIRNIATSIPPLENSRRPRDG